MRTRIALCIGVAVLVTAGCDPLGVFDRSEEPPENVTGQHIETTRDTYQWTGDTLTITYAYKNPFDQPVYMGGCADGRGPTHLFQKRRRGGWETIYGRVCLLVGGTMPTAIESGETYTATFTLDEGTQSEWANSVSGTYRVREPMYWTWDEEKHRRGTLETEDWWSNEFEIH